MSKKGKISDEDKVLFRESVDRLPRGKIVERRDEDDEPQPRWAPSGGEMTLNAEDALAYRYSSVDPRKFRKLKAGKMPIEATLDLHGMISDEAYNALLDFIERCRLNHRHCVCVVHGKGTLTHGKPILKNKVNYWLRQIDGVLAFVSTQPKDGGTGAVYIYLSKG